MTRNNKINWTLILGIPGAALALIGILTSLVSKDFRCSITHLVSIKSDQCTDIILHPFKLRILTETGEAIDKAEVDFIGNDAIEPVYTDRNGLVEGRVKNEGSVKISVKAKNYPVVDITYTTETEQPMIKELRIRKDGTGTFLDPNPISTPTTVPTSTPTTIPTLTPKPTLTPVVPFTPTASVLPIVEVWRNVTFQLNSCKRKEGGIVSCNFTLTSTEDINFSISLGIDTKIVDGFNNPYYVSKGYVGKINAGANNNLSMSMVKDAQSNVIIDFTGIPTSVSQAFLLNLNLPGYTNLPYRNIPIN